MQQINVFQFYLLGKVLNECERATAAREPLRVSSYAYQFAHTILIGFLEGHFKIQLDDSLNTATVLRDLLRKIIDRNAADGESRLSEEETLQFRWALNNFEQALGLELGRAPIFFVTPKGIYATRRLILDAAKVFEGYEDRVTPEAINDTNQAGRCLAFALATAAGFHINRATEAVIKQYMVVYDCAPIKDSQRNWGNYIKALAEKNANPKIIHHLSQMKDLHRNPLIHPEYTLNQVEALGLWGVSVSAIQAMVADMETKRPNPDPAIVAMLPPGELLPSDEP